MAIEQLRTTEKNNSAGRTSVPHVSTMDHYHKKAHFWGRLTLWAAIILTLSLPIYLSFILGHHPGWNVILTGFTAYAGVVVAIWFLEPIMYFPILGVSGTYIGFLSGNIGNMCLPSAAAAQNAIGADPGTQKGEISATLGIGAASLVNKLFLIPIILGGSAVIALIPENIQQIFPLILPAIFGAVLSQFAIKKPLFGVVALIIGIIVNIVPLVAYLKSLTSVIATVIICLLIEKKSNVKQL
ncbi:hypothetical protein [Virgibacillus alimentarius]|uniref:hypothetical protein n=1 Tax=Virgibacillus alimentarius TaxID=698769 RepID=UPI000493454D|nr:hypothetical protein [Virgibacillus alimentarius]